VPKAAAILSALGLVDVTVRRREDAHVDHAPVVVAHRHDLTELHEAQQARLHPLRELAEFVDEERAARSGFDAANARLDPDSQLRAPDVLHVNATPVVGREVECLCPRFDPLVRPLQAELQLSLTPEAAWRLDEGDLATRSAGLARSLRPDIAVAWFCESCVIHG